MSYTESKTLGVRYIDHHFNLYVNGTLRSNDIKLDDGTRIYVEEVEEEKIKDIDVNVKVNTEPFDNSVDCCGDHIGTLTGSIIGFKTANVASKIKNEKQIVSRVTSGFSSLIEQNLTLQNVGIEAEMHALAGELMQQCKELEHKHDVMNKDFNRIKSRYTSLFDEITKEMNSRIKQLIKPCFDFVFQIRQEQNRRIETSLLSVATTTGKESDSARIAIQASKMKGNAEKLISTARNYIVGNKSLNVAKNAFFLEGNGSDKVCYTPVVLCYSSDDSFSSKKQLFANPIIDGNADVKKSLLEASSNLLVKDMSVDDKKRIEDYYSMMLSELSDGSVRGQRIVALMKSFFDKNSVKTFVK
jgi:hypothetical protein